MPETPKERRGTMRRLFCPECESPDTECVHTEWYSDMVEETRICNDCPTQFTNQFGFDHQKTDIVGEPA